MRNPHLNRSLTLENPVQAADGAGGLVTTWDALGILWGELKPTSGREAASYGLPISRTMYKITVRAAANGSPRRPKPGQRMRSGIRTFVVEAVTEYDRDARYLTCLAKEEVAS
jgi:head-tail adaptor